MDCDRYVQQNLRQLAVGWLTLGLLTATGLPPAAAAAVTAAAAAAAVAAFVTASAAAATVADPAAAWSGASAAAAAASEAEQCPVSEGWDQRFLAGLQHEGSGKVGHSEACSCP